MTVKTLTLDSDAVLGNVSIAATAANGDTVVLPNGHSKLFVQVPAVTSCTMTMHTSISGTPVVDITKDLDGNAYPRATFTGNTIVAVRVPPGASVVLAATMQGGKLMSVQSAR